MRSISGLVHAYAGVARGASLCAGLSLLAACALPDAPEWDVGLTVPFSAEPLTIVDFLPPTVDTAVVGGQSVFAVDAQRDSAGYTLGEMCGVCGAFQGVTVTVPAFDYVDSLDVRFPDDMVAIEVLSGRLGARLHNQLNFDPLRPDPDPASAGYVAIALRDLSSGTLLDSLFISGAVESLPVGTSREFELSISDATIGEGVRAIFYVHSPEDGQTAQIDTALSAAVGAFLDQLLVQAVSVVVDADTLDESFRIDFEEDARDEIAQRVQSASYEFELIHTGEIEGTLEISIAESTEALFSGDSNREVRLTGLVFTSDLVQRGELTTDEVLRIAGFPDVYVGYRGVATGTRTGPRGLVNISRFTADQFLRTELVVISRVRLGG